MPGWKKLLLRSAGFGAGFAVVVCAVIGISIWYSGRPKPPKPWNKQAITAEYDYVRPEGDKNNLVFQYILQNNTALDYRVDSDAGIEITGKLKQEKGFSQFAGHYVTAEYPIFVPTKSRVWISLTIPYPYPTKEKDNANADERKQFTTGVAKYVTNELSNLDGFVLFDTTTRYEIDFPSGWEQRAKEISTSSSAWRPNWETVPDKNKTRKSELSPTIAFTDAWLGFVPDLSTDEQRKLHEQDKQHKELFLQAFGQLPECKGITFMQSNPKDADFDMQIFNGIDGRSGKWQWVLYRTDIIERLAFGEEPNVSDSAKSVCSAVRAKLPTAKG